MPTRSSKDRDFVSIARQVVEKAIGEQLDGSPLVDPDAGKNPAAVALGKLGGANVFLACPTIFPSPLMPISMAFFA